MSQLQLLALRLSRAEFTLCRRRILPKRERRDTQRLQTGGESIWRRLDFNDRTAPGQAVAGADEAANGGASFRFEGQRDRDGGNVAPARRPPGTEVACGNRYSLRPDDDFNESINH